jgi:predicted ArsR family transcriptional regulator
MDWLDRLIGGTRARLLRLVRGRSVSINELAAGVGITDNAVRGHVAALERDGLVRARAQRATGGKPARLYELTPEAEELFPKAYALVLTELLTTIREEQGEEAMLARLRDVGRRLGVGGAAGHASTAGRVAAVSALLESLGGSIEAERTGEGWTLRSAGCPLSRVVAQNPEVCRLVESVVAEATQCEAREICDRTGLPRCAFVVRESHPESSAAEPTSAPQ